MKTIVLLLFTTIMFSQTSIVSGGNSSETFGETFGYIQQFNMEQETGLDIPTTPVKIVVKKKTIWEKFIESISK